MADATDLNALATEFLARCAEALDSIPAPLDGAPTRQFVAPSQPADDCEQLVVYIPGIAEAPTDPQGLPSTRRAGRGFWINHVTIVGRITRECFPVGTLTQAPSPSQMNATSAQTNADAWALWNHLHEVVRAGVFQPKCKEFGFQAMRPIPMSGGVGGWVITALVQLDGFDEAIGT